MPSSSAAISASNSASKSPEERESEAVCLLCDSSSAKRLRTQLTARHWGMPHRLGPLSPNRRSHRPVRRSPVHTRKYREGFGDDKRSGAKVIASSCKVQRMKRIKWGVKQTSGLTSASSSSKASPSTTLASDLTTQREGEREGGRSKPPGAQ